MYVLESPQSYIMGSGTRPPQYQDNINIHIHTAAAKYLFPVQNGGLKPKLFSKTKSFKTTKIRLIFDTNSRRHNYPAICTITILYCGGVS